MLSDLPVDKDLAGVLQLASEHRDVEIRKAYLNEVGHCKVGGTALSVAEYDDCMWLVDLREHLPDFPALWDLIAYCGAGQGGSVS